MSLQAAMAMGTIALQSGLSAINQRAQSRFLFAQSRRAAEFGVTAAQEVSRAGRASVSTATARAGASGFTTSGSAEDVIARLAQEAETSRQRALYEGFREADDLRYQAQVARQNANRSSALAGITGGVNAFLLSRG